MPWPPIIQHPTGRPNLGDLSWPPWLIYPEWTSCFGCLVNSPTLSSSEAVACWESSIAANFPWRIATKFQDSAERAGLLPPRLRKILPAARHKIRIRLNFTLTFTLQNRLLMAANTQPFKVKFIPTETKASSEPAQTKSPWQCAE